jgi:hypothetical protein
MAKVKSQKLPLVPRFGCFVENQQPGLHPRIMRMASVRALVAPLPPPATASPFGGFRFAFAWGQEQVGFQAVLLGAEVVVAALLSVERRVKCQK